MTTYANVRFAYSVLLERNKWWHYTVAYIRSEDEVVFSFTRCNPLDTFTKKIGRDKTLLRLNEGFTQTIDFQELNEYYQDFLPAGATNVGIDNDPEDCLDFKHWFISSVILAKIGAKNNAKDIKTRSDWQFMQNELNTEKKMVNTYG